MKVSIYSTAFNLSTPRGASFDVPGALSNWAVYADEISVACNDDESLVIVQDAAIKVGVRDKMVLTRTTFDFASDPFAYGRTENSALQACTGDLLIQQNLDERILVDKQRLKELQIVLQAVPEFKAFWVPTIDLYGSADKCLPKPSQKWYIHTTGLFRGPYKPAIKPDGHPDYNRTSTDELLGANGQLANAVAITYDYSLEGLKGHVSDGWPISYHLGYLNLADRLERSLWWKAFWEKATNGDSNQHPTSVEEMAKKVTVSHGLPLWPTIPLDPAPITS